jgi:hypothetical protein
MTNLTSNQLREALVLRQKIDDLETELSQLLGSAGAARTGRSPGRPPKILGVVGKRPRRTMSAATKARIAAAARKRWKRAKAAGKRTLAG